MLNFRASKMAVSKMRMSKLLFRSKLPIRRSKARIILNTLRSFRHLTTRFGPS